MSPSGSRKVDLPWREMLQRIQAAYSPNTIRCYRYDFTVFEDWCRKEGRSALPATPETVALFVLVRGEADASATVRRRLAAISRIHCMLKYGCPIHTEEVNIAMRTVIRQKGRWQAQALGLTAALKQQLINACPDSLRGLRDRALLAVGYDSLCRRSELVQLQIENLSISSDRSGSILVHQSKSIQYGEVRLAYLSVETMDHLQNWLRASALVSGSIFRGIRGSTVLRDTLHPYSVARVLKDCAEAADLDHSVVEGLSGHSMRVGATQDMVAAGIDIAAIMHAGGWKSPDMVMRYAEHMNIRHSGMAKLYSTVRALGDQRPDLVER